MAIGIMKFKKPSQIIFKVEKTTDEEPVTRLRDISYGVTFMHRDAVFMRVDVSGYQATRKMPAKEATIVEDVLNTAYWVINLQTGRVFILSNDTEIDLIKVTMTVAGE